MAQQELDGLRKRFREGLLEGYEVVKQETGYNATYFLRMVQESENGVDAAKRLLAKEGYSEGLARLWEEGRLDLSMEAYLLSPEFAPLFTEAERAIARQRLLDYGYDPDKLKNKH